MSQKYVLVQKEKMHTPPMRIKYATLGEPNFFQGDDKGEYSVTFAVDPDAAEIADWIEENEAEAELLKHQFAEESNIKLKNVQVSEPFFPRKIEYDAEDNETGLQEFKFKMRAQHTAKKTGKTYKFKPGIFDSKGEPITDIELLKNIGQGTIARASYDLKVYKFGNTVGSSLVLRAVQIIELVERRSAARDVSNDFAGMETEGFEVEMPENPGQDVQESSEFEAAN